MFGMNFLMPEWLRSASMWVVTSIGMLGLGAGLFIYFKRKRWL